MSDRHTRLAPTSTLLESGFAAIPGLILPPTLGLLSAAYDREFARGEAPDLRRSSTGSDVRLQGLIGRGWEFAELHTLGPVLEACESLIGEPFKLSSLLGRTVLPGAQKQGLHVDVRPDEDAWPLVGFIVMVDAFTADNGATRFVPASHTLERGPTAYETNQRPDERRGVPACGDAGSVIVYSGSTWHGYGENRSGTPRRSIQGAYIPRRGRSEVDWNSRLSPEVVERLSVRAKELLGVS